MIVEFVIIVFAYTALALSVFASYEDFRKMQIPNYIPIFIGVIFFGAYFLEYASNTLLGTDIHIFQGLKSHLFAFAITFVISFAMFSFKMIGGGDSKLAAAISLWAGLHYLSGFLIVMAFAGGLVGVVSLYFKKAKPFKHPEFSVWVSKTQSGEGVVPYGIALGVAAVFVFYKAGYLFLL